MSREYCPRCQSVLESKKEPFKVRDTYVGAFEAMSCPICGYYYFTDVEYDSALDQARALGLVGPVEPIASKNLLPGMRSDFVLTSQAFELEIPAKDLLALGTFFTLRFPVRGEISLDGLSEPGIPEVRTPPIVTPAETKVTYGLGEP